MCVQYTMFKLPPFLTIALLVVVIFVALRSTRSKYRLSPSPVSITSKATGSLTSLPYKMGCVPGPTKEAAYYTKDLTPGGVCGGQALVAAQAEYSILGGIGGSLMEQ